MTFSFKTAIMPIRTRGAIAALACLLPVSTLAAQAPIATVAVEGRASANPSLASSGQFVAIAFSAATTNAMDVFVATSLDGGQTFSPPTQVNAVPGDARVSGEEPPRVALVPRKGSTPEIVVVWTARTGPNWRLLTAKSTDGGRSFSASRAVPGSEGDGARGWQSVSVDATGRVFVLWLDHRETVVADAMHKHEAAGAQPAPPMAKPDPTTRAGLSQLYFAALDGSSAIRITRSVCYCCKTSLATAGNNVYAVWRHVYPGSQRDIAFSMSNDRGRTFSAPLRVSEDHWQIDGCPDNGPAIAIDRERRAHVVWPTPADGKDVSALALFYAVSRDGRAFSARTRIPSRGPASHPQIVIGQDGSPVVGWDEIVDGKRRLALARVSVDAAGTARFTTLPSPDSGPGQWYPTLAATPTGTLVAWVKQLEKGTAIGVARVK